VFLNLIGNGFYAAAKRSREAADGYRPVLRVSKWDLGNEIEMRVRDNGTAAPSRWTANWVPIPSSRHGCRGAAMAVGQKTDHEPQHFGRR
jgi:hypothetical protein